MSSEQPMIRAQGGGFDPSGGYGAPPPAGAGGPGGYGGPPVGYPAPQPPPYGEPHDSGAAGPRAELKKQATKWLIGSALSFLLCSGVNCFGLIGAILCFLAMQAADQGHVADAESKLKWGKIITVSGAVLSLIAILLSSLWYLVISAVR